METCCSVLYCVQGSGLARAVFSLEVVAAVCGGWLAAVSGCKLTGSLLHAALLPAPLAIHLLLFLVGVAALTLAILAARPGCPAHCACCARCCCGGRAEDSLAVAHAVFAETEAERAVVIKSGDTVTLATDVKANIEDMKTKSNGYSRFP